MLMKMKNMGAISFLLLLLLFSASLFSTSLAGRGRSKLAEEGDASQVHEEVVVAADTEVEIVRERLLKVNAKDYGRYDPAPTLVRPPFKLIPK